MVGEIAGTGTTIENVGINDANDDRLAVNADGSINVKQVTETQKTVTLVANSTPNSASTTLKTVGAGKKVTIVGCSVTCMARGTTSLYKSQITAKGTAILTAQNYSLTEVGQGGVSESQRWNYAEAPVLLEGETIVHVTTGNGTNTHQTCEVQYIEEDV